MTDNLTPEEIKRLKMLVNPQVSLRRKIFAFLLVVFVFSMLALSLIAFISQSNAMPRVFNYSG